MATITKLATPSLASNLPPPSQQETGQVAGEALGKFDAVYLKSADGKWYKATGVAAAAAAEVNGYAAEAYAIGDKHCTIYFGGITVTYASGMTPGGEVFLDEATAGALNTAVGAAGGTRKLGFILDAARIRLYTVQGR